MMRLKEEHYDVSQPIKDCISASKQLKVCFLITHVPNPRMNKRIEVLKKITNTMVICTRRASQNIWEPTQNVKHVIFDIDLPSADHIIKRFILSIGFQKKVLKNLFLIKPDVLYTESLDSLIIAKKYKKKNCVNIVFESADISKKYITAPEKILDKITTFFLLRKEKDVFKDVNYLVVTSPKFYEVHYKNLILPERTIFIPNAPDVQVFKHYKKKENGPFTIGFIGEIRYIRQMKMLVDVAEKIGCHVLFAGAGSLSSNYEEIRKYCRGKDFVRFTGRYNYDAQIAELYGMIDCVYSVYDADDPNVKIALPNKLYEAIICELPIIVAKETYLGELVEHYGVGVCVSHKDKTELEQVIRLMKDSIQYRHEFSKKCKEYKTKYNDDTPLNDLKKIVLELQAEER